MIHKHLRPNLGDGTFYKHVKDILTRGFQCDPDTAQMYYTLAGDRGDEIANSFFQIATMYTGLTCEDQRYRLKWYHVPWCNPAVWWELRVLGSPWGCDVPTWLSSLRSTVQVITKWCGPFMHDAMAFRKAVDVRRDKFSYLDSLPEISLSTYALVVALMQKHSVGRPASHRLQVFHFLKAFLSKYFSSEDIELNIRSRCLPKLHMGTCHPQPDFSIVVDKCMAYLIIVG